MIESGRQSERGGAAVRTAGFAVTPYALSFACGLLVMALEVVATRLVALAMAGNMLGAIVFSGLGEGEVVPSLTLAPLLLAGMLFLIWVGPGRRALDGRLLAGHTDAIGGHR